MWVFIPSTQRHYRRLILPPSPDLTHTTGCKHPRLNIFLPEDGRMTETNGIDWLHL
jgi:hypothetical protein